MTYTIYTDGSDLKHTSRRLGIGGILINTETNEEIGRFSKELNRSVIQRDYGTSECSNPFAEMVATLEALRLFSTKFKAGDKVLLKADYQGVRDWCTGAWKTRAPFIRKVKQEIDEILKNTPWSVEFVWIKGHQKVLDQDSYWNDVVDKLAKGLG